MKMRTIVILMLVFWTILASRAQSSFRVSPNAWDNNDGNSFFITPFDAAVSARFQQVYTPLTFVPIQNSAFLINGISFRVDSPFGNGFFTTLPDIQINFSTTIRAPDGLSANFALNIGATETVMIPRGPLTLSGTHRADLSVQSLDIFIDFATPYRWDPRDGNLLLDVMNYSGRNTSPFDAVDLFGDDVSSVFGAVEDSSGTLSSRGLVTGLDVTIVPVPEPSSIALMSLGFLGLALGWKERRSRKEARHVAH